MQPIDLDRCRECPCFQVNGCAECKHLLFMVDMDGEDKPACVGSWPAECRPEDCVGAKQLAAEGGHTGVLER